MTTLRPDMVISPVGIGPVWDVFMRGTGPLEALCAETGTFARPSTVAGMHVNAVALESALAEREVPHTYRMKLQEGGRLLRSLLLGNMILGRNVRERAGAEVIDMRRSLNALPESLLFRTARETAPRLVLNEEAGVLAAVNILNSGFILMEQGDRFGDLTQLKIRTEPLSPSLVGITSLKKLLTTHLYTWTEGMPKEDLKIYFGRAFHVTVQFVSKVNGHAVAEKVVVRVNHGGHQWNREFIRAIYDSGNWSAAQNMTDEIWGYIRTIRDINPALLAPSSTVELHATPSAS